MDRMTVQFRWFSHHSTLHLCALVLPAISQDRLLKTGERERRVAKSQFQANKFRSYVEEKIANARMPLAATLSHITYYLQSSLGGRISRTQPGSLTEPTRDSSLVKVFVPFGISWTAHLVHLAITTCLGQWHMARHILWACAIHGSVALIYVGASS